MTSRKRRWTNCCGAGSELGQRLLSSFSIAVSSRPFAGDTMASAQRDSREAMSSAKPATPYTRVLASNGCRQFVRHQGNRVAASRMASLAGSAVCGASLTATRTARSRRLGVSTSNTAARAASATPPLDGGAPAIHLTAAAMFFFSGRAEVS
ncbi:hypothetical protein ACWDOR_20795 [Streptosporangium canum]